MVKRVFKIIGIVMASVLGFAGAFVGVMAAMGKFKTPIVYPDSLQFEYAEQTIVYNERLDTEENPSWFYFTLNGLSKSGNQVNQKNCYISFVGGVGSDLITLYDKNRVKIEPTNNRYLVECDERVYYRLKKDVDNTHYTKADYGKVVITAVDEKNLVESTEDLTIWIDRAVTDISLDTNKGEIEGDTQIISLSLGAQQKFEFNVSPEHSLNPNSKRYDNKIQGDDGKIVEIYYDNNSGDYALINNSTISQYSFMTKDEETGTYVFSTDVAGTYKFKIAVFASYADRAEYLSDPAYIHDANYERIAEMVSKSVNIKVVNSDVTDVGFKSGVGLNLYTDNNYITLNGVSSGVANANDNNLQLYMKDNNGDDSTVRFNETVFNTTDDDYRVGGLMFVNNEDSTDYFAIDSTSRVTQSSVQIGNATDGYKIYNIKLDNKTITDANNVKRTLVKELTDSSGTITYVSDVDAVVLEDIITNEGGTVKHSYSLKRLVSGSYLGLYEVTNAGGNTNYSAATFNYSVDKPINSGTAKSWKIVVMEKPSETIHLGILVVNNSGTYYFDSVEVTFNTVDLVYEFIKDNHDLDISYKLADGEYQRVYSELAVSDIVNIKAGTYDACVFVTPVTSKYSVDVLTDVTYMVEETAYCLVGYFDGINFVNKVRARARGANSSPIYMLQLKNEYGKDGAQTVENYLYQQSLTFTYIATIDGIKSELTLMYDKAAKVFKATVGGTTYTEGEFSFNGNSEIILNDNIYKYESIEYTSVVLSKDNIVNSHYLTNAVNINVNYALSSDIIEATFDESDIEKDNGKYYAYEETNGYTLYFTSKNSLVLADILNSGHFNPIARLHYNGEVTDTTDIIRDIEYVEYEGDDTLTDKGIKITFNTGEEPTNPNYYATIVFTYNGVEIESKNLYIKSTDPEDIDVKYSDYTTDLADKASDVTNNDAYINIIVGYDTTNNEYTYTYQLISKTSGIIVDNETSLDNVLRNNGWFVVKKEIAGKDRTIDFTSQNDKIFTLTKSTGESEGEGVAVSTNYELVINSLGSTTMSLTSKTVTRYIEVAIVSDGNFVFKSNITNTTIETNQFNNLVSFTHNGTSIATNRKYVNAELSVLSSGAGGTTVVPVDTDEDDIEDTIYVMLSTYTTGDSLEDSYLLKLYSDETNGWTLLRSDSYKNTTFTIKLTLTTLVTGNVELTLKFDSSVAVDQRWLNCVVYAGTEVLLAVEYSDSYNGTDSPVFAIKNKETTSFEIIIKKKISNTEYTQVDKLTATDSKYIHTFTEVGKFKLEFTLGTTVITKEINVLPNAVCISHKEELYSNTTYNILTELLSLNAFKTGVTYGSGTTLYTNRDGSYITDNLISITADTNVTIEEVNTTKYLDTTTSNNVTTKWLSTINGTVPTTINVKYNGETIASDLAITIRNGVTAITQPIELMANKAVDVSGEEYLYIEHIYDDSNSITLNSVNNNAFIVIDGKLKYNANVTVDTTINSVELTFYWNNDSSKTLTWTGNIVVTPYMPVPVENLTTIYSSTTGEYDFLKIFFDFDNFTDEDKANISAIGFQDSGKIKFPEYNGYIKGTSMTTAVADIAAIIGDTYDEIVDVNIDYINPIDGTKDGTYHYELHVTIKNRQTITLNYPFEGLSTTNSFHLSQGDAIALTNNANATEGNYTLTNVYEPVLVGDSIDFASDEYLRKRVTIKDNITGEYLDAIADISVVGYLNNGQRAYLDITTTDTTKVKFNVLNGFGSYTMAILKITTTTGAYDYYFVNIYKNQNLSDRDNIDFIGTDYNLTGGAPTYVTDSASGTILFNNTSLNRSFYNNNYGLELTSTNQVSKIKTYLLDARDINGKLIFDVDDEDKLYNVVSGNIPTPTQYSKITLGFVYDDTNVRYYIGSYTINVRPVNYEEVNKDEDGNPLVTRYNTSYATGEYTKTLDINDTTFELPFSFEDDKYTLTDVESTIDESIVSVDTTGLLTIKSYPTTDVNFEVKYKFGEGGVTKLTLIVYYTLTGFDLDTAFKGDSYTIGTYGDNTFDNTLAFNEIVSGYNKKFDCDIISYKGENTLTTDQINELVSYDDDTREFTFTQGTSQYTLTIRLTMTELKDTPYKTINVTVNRNLAYSFNTAVDSGVDGTHVKATDATTINYNSQIGSILKVTKTAYTAEGNIDESGMNTATYRYSIAGLTIITRNNAKLLITVNNATYVLGYTTKADNITTAYGSGLTISEPGTIDFTHSATAVGITLTIKVIDISADIYYQTYEPTSGNYVDFSTNLYISVSKTYNGLISKYIWDGAGYEAITSGSSIHNLHSVLFESLDISDVDSDGNVDANKRRIYLEDTDGNEVNNYDAVAMGFISGTITGAIVETDNINNPNYIVVTSTSLQYNIDTDTLTASSTANIISTTIYLDTLSGTFLCNYDYRILPTDDLITYANVPNGVKDEVDYATILIKDTVTTSSYKIDKPITIGTLNNTNNNKFYMTAEQLSNDGDKTTVHAVRTINSNDGTITYSFTKTGYTYSVIYNNNDKTISVDISRTEGNALQSKFIFDLNIYLEGSKDCDTLRLAIYNASISGPTSTYSVYGDSTVELYNGIINITNNANDDSFTPSYALVTENESSYYQYSGVTNSTIQYITAENNPLYNLNKNENTLTIKPVGVEVYSYNTFAVSADGYLLGTIVYEMTIKPDYKFTTIKETANEAVNESWNGYDTKATAYTFDQDNLTIESGKFKYTFDLTEEINGLGLKLFSLDYEENGQGNPDYDTDIITIREISNLGGAIVNISGTRVTFYTDYTGVLELELSVNTSHGSYTKYWDINITGFASLSYPDGKSEDSILTKSGGESFVSGDTVNIVAGTSAEGVGLIMSRQTADGVVIDYSTADTTGSKFSIKFVDAEYMIHNCDDATTSLDVSTLPWSSDGILTVDYNNEYLAKITLPNVEENTNRLVVIKLTMNYYSLDNMVIDSKDYYVVYKVFNNLTISANETSVDVDDNDLFTGNKLGLLYMVEDYYATYTDSDNATTIYLFRKYLDDGKNIKLQVFTPTKDESTGVVTYDSVHDTLSYVDINTYTNTNNTAIFTTNNIIKYGRTLTDTELETQSYPEYKVDTTTSGAVGTDDNVFFTTNLGTIENFKNYIDSIDSVQLVNVNGIVNDYKGSNYNSTDKTLDYDLKYINNGVWGIELGTNTLFNNELTAELRIISSAGLAIKKVEDFSLTTNNKITANTTNIKVSSIFKYSDWIELEGTDASLTKQTVMNYNVIGITASDTPGDWTNAGVAGSSGDKIATITVPGTPTPYELYMATYNNGESGLYKLTANFYYIKSTTGTILVPKYTYGSVEAFETARNVLNLNGKFILYSMDTNNTITSKPNDAAVAVTKSSTNIYDNPDFNNEASITEITVDAAWLQAYKNSNPSLSYLTLKYTATYGGIAVDFNTQFLLPSSTMATTVTNNIFEVKYTSTATDITLDLKDKVYVIGTSGNTYLTSENSGSFSITADAGTTGSKCGITGTEISISKDNVTNNYEEQFTITYGTEKITITVRFKLS